MFRKAVLSVAAAILFAPAFAAPAAAQSGYERPRYKPSCHYETVKVRSGYGWIYKKVRVCR